MPKNHISPHDRFVRSLMTNPKVIKEFFDKHLPQKIKDAMDFSSIELQKESFIGDKLRLQIADLLYSVRINGKPSYLYVLLEHASKPDKLLPFRMLKYMTAVMDSHIKKTGEPKLPLIYPIILYTGNKAYRHSMDLFDLFGEQKEFAKEILTAPYQLIDLTQMSDEELRPYLWFGTLAMIAKHIHDKDILPFMTNLIEILRELANENEGDYIITVISYIFEAGEISDKEEFFKAMKSLETINEEKIMTLAEIWKQEGRKEGVEKGRKEGIEETKKETARSLLDEGVDINIISSATGLSLQEIKNFS